MTLFFQRKSFIIAAIVIVLLGIAAAVFFISKTPQQELPSDTLPRPSYEMFLKLHASFKQARPEWDAEVNEESLRLGDVDGDGDIDTVGFLVLSSGSGRSSAVLATWIQEGEDIRLYSDGYNGFRTNAPDDCLVVGISTGALSLDCTQGRIGKTITLRYQPNGTGYYRDFVSEAVVYAPQEGWSSYESVSSGVSFSYPPHIVVDEEVFIAGKERLSIISGTREGAPSFYIVTKLSEPSSGGSLISSDSTPTFLNLPDGSYLSRRESGTQGKVTYQESFADKVNNEGTIFASSTFSPIREGALHLLYGYPHQETGLEEVDRIFSSLTFAKAALSAPVHPAASSTISLSRGFSITVPASTEPDVVIEKGGVLEQRGVLVRPIPIPVYDPISLSVTLVPYGSVAVMTAIGGGGYDADTNLCYHHDIKNTSTPLTIQGISACEYGYADGSEAAHGYYLLDPSRRFIAQVQVNGWYDRSLFDLASVVQTARFAP